MNKKKKDILQAALKEFSQNSFDEASINTIIKVSNTSKGTFYHYFQDKSDLYIQLMQQTNETKWRFIQEEMAGQAEPAPSANIFDLFKQQALYGIQFAKQYPQYHELGKRFSSEQGNNIYEVVIQQLAMDQKEDELFESLFSEAYQNGEFNTHYSLEFIKQTVLFLFNHFDEIYFDPEESQKDKLDHLNNLIEFMKFGFSGLMQNN
jgi:AcrR family transcriptional regulator